LKILVNSMSALESPLDIRRPTVGILGLAFLGNGSSGRRKPGWNHDFFFAFVGGVGGVALVGRVLDRGRRLGGWRLGIGGGREAVRLSVHDSLSFGWNVTIGEQDSGLGRVHRDLMHETLHKGRIPVFVQEPKANFGMMYEGMCVRVRENELEKSGDIVQATYATLIRSLICSSLIHMWSNRQAAIRTVAGWVEAWQAAVVVDCAIPFLRRELTHWHEKEISNGDLDIEWKWRIGHGEVLQASRGGAAGKGDFFLQG
jgi:hypothetical protein